MNFDSEKVNRVYNESRGRIVRSLEQHTYLPDDTYLEQFVSKFINKDFTREELEKAIIASQQEGMQYVYNQLDEEGYLFIHVLPAITDELVNTLRRSSYHYYCREEFSKIELVVRTLDDEYVI